MDDSPVLEFDQLRSWDPSRPDISSRDEYSNIRSKVFLSQCLKNPTPGPTRMEAYQVIYASKLILMAQ